MHREEAEVDPFKGNGSIDSRVARIERWIVAHEEWCRGQFNMINQTLQSNSLDHQEIKHAVEENRKALSHVNLYIGGAIVIATVIGSVITELLTRHVP